MNTIFKHASALLLALLMAFSITACGTTPANTSSSSESDNEQPYELQMEISQEDWDDHRQYVELSTGITMSYVEMGDPDGDPLILQHGMTDNSWLPPTLPKPVIMFICWICAAMATAINPTPVCIPLLISPMTSLPLWTQRESKKPIW